MQALWHLMTGIEQEERDDEHTLKCNRIAVTQTPRTQKPRLQAHRIQTLRLDIKCHHQSWRPCRFEIGDSRNEPGSPKMSLLPLQVIHYPCKLSIQSPWGRYVSGRLQPVRALGSPPLSVPLNAVEVRFAELSSGFRDSRSRNSYLG